MLRRLILGTLCALVLLPSNLLAQHRIGPQRGTNVVITGGVPTYLDGLAARPTVIFGGPYFNVPLGGEPYSLPPATVFHPFVYAPSIYGARPFSEAQSYVSPRTARATDIQQPRDLSNELERLKRQIQRMQEERPPSNQSSQTTSDRRPQSGDAARHIVLVFRDGRRSEFDGYAIVGETVWATTEQISTRIPVSDLDLETTQRLNMERGIRFPLPRKP
jgi:hypothetical protein